MISQHAELKVIDHAKEEEKARHDEWLHRKEKGEGQFKYYA